MSIVKELLKYGAHISKNENGMYWWINPRVIVEPYNSTWWKREFNDPCTIIIFNCCTFQQHYSVSCVCKRLGTFLTYVFCYNSTVRSEIRFCTSAACMFLSITFFFQILQHQTSIFVKVIEGRGSVRLYIMCSDNMSLSRPRPPHAPVAPTLEHRASVTCIFLLQFHNPKTVFRTPWMGDQPVTMPLPTQTQNKQTSFYAFSGIRARDPSVRAVEGSSCLRPRVHCDITCLSHPYPTNVNYIWWLQKFPGSELSVKHSNTKKPCNLFAIKTLPAFRYLLDLKFPRQWLWRVHSSGLKCHVVRREPRISEEAEKFCLMYTMLQHRGLTYYLYICSTYLWRPPHVTSSFAFFEASGTYFASMNHLAGPSSEKRHKNYVVQVQENYSAYHSNLCSKKQQLTYQGIVMQMCTVCGCFITCDNLWGKVYIVICCRDPFLSLEVITLLLHQRYWCSMFADVMHIQTLTEDSMTATNWKTGFLFNHLSSFDDYNTQLSALVSHCPCAILWAVHYTGHLSAIHEHPWTSDASQDLEQGHCFQYTSEAHICCQSSQALVKFVYSSFLKWSVTALQNLAFTGFPLARHMSYVLLMCHICFFVCSSWRYLCH
jgi:hypothetical protein